MLQSATGHAKSRAPFMFRRIEQMRNAPLPRLADLIQIDHPERRRRGFKLAYDPLVPTPVHDSVSRVRVHAGDGAALGRGQIVHACEIGKVPFQ